MIKLNVGDKIQGAKFVVTVEEITARGDAILSWSGEDGESFKSLYKAENLESLFNAGTFAKIDENGVEIGVTGEDWEPTESTRFYAQKGEQYAFGATEKEALANLEASEQKQYANRVLYSDVFPFEVVKTISDKTLEIREMDATLDPSWKPEMVVGGFSAHTTNNHSQKWVIVSDIESPVIRIRKHKSGQWKDKNGNTYSLNDKPVRKHDYNF